MALRVSIRDCAGASLLLTLGALAGGCGPTAATAPTGEPDALPSYGNPPLICTDGDKSCECAAGDGGVLEASAGLCDNAVAAGAACCTVAYYPFAGACRCAVGGCPDGGVSVPSCSAPPSEIDLGACDPTTCTGMSCGGGQCCVSSCQAGMCQSSCS